MRNNALNFEFPISTLVELFKFGSLNFDIGEENVENILKHCGVILPTFTKDANLNTGRGILPYLVLVGTSICA